MQNNNGGQNYAKECVYTEVHASSETVIVKYIQDLVRSSVAVMLRIQSSISEPSSSNDG